MGPSKGGAQRMKAPNAEKVGPQTKVGAEGWGVQNFALSSIFFLALVGVLSLNFGGV